MALPPFALRYRTCRLEPWLDRSILGMEIGQVWNEIFHDFQVGQRIDAYVVGDIIDALCASQRVGAVDVHRAGPQTPSRHDRRKVSVWSTSFLILIRASSTIGPHVSRSTS